MTWLPTIELSTGKYVHIDDVREALGKVDVEALQTAYENVMALAPGAWPTPVRWQMIADFYARLVAEKVESARGMALEGEGQGGV